jgi:hypothetical protein
VTEVGDDGRAGSVIRPVCFVIMPYGCKETGLARGAGPERVNFDDVWDRCLAPALDELGFTAVRADQDIGPYVIQEMLERLTLSDLVVADVSIPNGNVYYETGVRHASKRHHCVLIGAAWAKPLFDLGQIRRVKYSLVSDSPVGDEAAKIRSELAAGVEKLRNAPSLMTSLATDPTAASAFQDMMRQLSRMQAAVRATRAAPEAERRVRAEAILQQYVGGGGDRPMQEAVALEMLKLVRDVLGWERATQFVDGLPPEIRALPMVDEQYQLARSGTGKHVEAIAALEALVERHGDSSERQGLIAGRFKRLFRTAQNPADRARYLSKAIEHYERGMYLDLNDYFPSCNLAQLYRARGAPGDEGRALAVAQLVAFACERARVRGRVDEWLKPTLVGAAFDAADVERARELAAEIAAGDVDSWKLRASLADWAARAKQAPDDGRRADLVALVDELRRLVPD